MIKIGDNYYRNLEEQVQKNKEDIANHYNIDRVLAEVGIKVIGQLPTPEDLEDKVGIEYGDAYAIGTEPPYDFYVWTRADVDSGHLEDYWFNIGQLAIVGPQGPTGPKGEKGDIGESSMWYYGTTPSNPREGDMLLQSSGNVLRYQKVGPLQYSWVQVVNIKGANGLNGLQGPQGATGPQGPQGPKGDTGDVGGFINIYGILTNVNQLPNPDTLNNRTIAYLIGTGYPYDLYIQVGDADGPVTWVNSGPLNVSTLVFVNGEAQNTWNADVKADVTYVDNAIASIHFPEPDLTDYATKQYVDTAIANIDIPEPDLTGYATEAYVNEAVKNVEVDLTDYATKQYVDDAIADIDIPEGGGSEKTQITIKTMDSPETLALLAEAYSWGVEGNGILDKYDITYVRNGIPYSSANIISAFVDVGGKYLIMTFIDEDLRRRIIAWSQTSNKLEFWDGAQILTSLNYHDYINISGGSSWYTIEAGNWTGDASNAREIYICLQDDNTGCVYYSYVALPNDDTLLLWSHSYFVFATPSGMNYGESSPSWYFDGSEIVIQTSNSYTMYWINYKM